jgi:hypothetical protein
VSGKTGLSGSSGFSGATGLNWLPAQPAQDGYYLIQILGGVPLWIQLFEQTGLAVPTLQMVSGKGISLPDHLL